MKKRLRVLVYIMCGLFLFLNGIAAMHAWHFTHFSPGVDSKTDPRSLSIAQQLKIALTGVTNPRPVNGATPAMPYETVRLTSNYPLECWLMKTAHARGTIILFHGYTGSKATMLDKAEVFLQLGYNVLMADFMGAGGSGGNQTTIGYHEAENVKTCYNYVVKTGEKNILLFGTSMGAVAILRAIHAHSIKPQAIMIECPFGTMQQTVEARFRMMHLPSFPMAGLLLFWGGVENGFWAYGHNPQDYARSVNCPALLMFGAKDDRVTIQEINAVYNGLKGYKELRIYPEAAHENYLIKYKERWTQDVRSFLQASGAESGTGHLL
jgi:alpha-beta hydrolase superfamily lysophospholipase